MTHAFLSDDWFAAQDVLFAEDGVPELPAKLAGIVLNINATDDDGGDVRAVTYRGCYFERGHADDAGALLTTPRGLCFQVFLEKKMALGVRALATGAAKLKGDKNQMMPIRAAKPTPSQAAYEAKVREMTAV
jgi:hypothetical protein